jgi:hypothetical protein
MAFGDAADFGDLIVLDEDLQTCSHVMSIPDSLCGVRGVLCSTRWILCERGAKRTQEVAGMVATAQAIKGSESLIPSRVRVLGNQEVRVLDPKSGPRPR